MFRFYLCVFRFTFYRRRKNYHSFRFVRVFERVRTIQAFPNSSKRLENWRFIIYFAWYISPFLLFHFWEKLLQITEPHVDYRIDFRSLYASSQCKKEIEIEIRYFNCIAYEIISPEAWLNSIKYSLESNQVLAWKTIWTMEWNR